MENNKTFACAITCMDGRIQQPVAEYIKRQADVAYVDVVSEPGPDGILAKGQDQLVIENIKKRVEVSVHHHQAKAIYIVAHEECAGNPVQESQHVADLMAAKKVVEGFGCNLPITLLFVASDWKTIHRY